VGDGVTQDRERRESGLQDGREDRRRTETPWRQRGYCMTKLIDGNGKIITEIPDKQGRILFQYDHAFETLDELDLTEAQLLNIECEGLWCNGTNFTRADLRNANLYWAMAFDADFSQADLSGAQLQGAALKGADFTSANLSGTNFGRDNLGG
jgi:uncharacterized protein YjbI with pentapeptide repeats